MINNTIIYKQLKHLGVPANLLGYRYLQEAMSIVLEDPEIINQITKKVYPKVAEICDSTSSRVERDIRYAVEYVFEHTDYNVLYRYFGNTNSNSGKLTSVRFIAGVAEYIKMEVWYE